MAPPPKKQNPFERIAYLNDSARLMEQNAMFDEQRKKQVEKSKISDAEVRRIHAKRKHNDDDDDLSVVTPVKHPKAIQGHNAFDRSTYWNTPNKKRESKKPTDIYITNTNKVCSPTSTLDSPVAGARRKTNTSNFDTGTNISNEVCE